MKFISNKKGFTLVELLVSMSIISAMAAISIASYPAFSEQVSVSGETYKMLAFFKETQSYGVASLAQPGVKVVYGFSAEVDKRDLARFELVNPGSTTSLSYIDTVSTLTASVTSTIKDRFIVSEINGYINNSTTSLQKVYAFYKRPNPESRLVGVKNSESSLQVLPDNFVSSFDKIEIVIQSKKNSKFIKKIVILQTGQMYVADW